MLVYRSRLFDLYSTDVAARSAPFEFVLHRGSCAALLIDPEGRIGLLRHERPAIGRTLFEIPAGTLDYARPIEEIMANELREEVSLEIDPEQMRRLTSLYASPGYSSELLTLFHIGISAEQRNRAKGLRWFTREEVNERIRLQEIMDMKTVAAITAFQAVGWRGDNA